ncbi:hypothetical protein B0F90DRAFT_361047 [Multifurca ochricompacta]|uniref:F-box domain-containing protein n=1 Tax=Multifurca ochricompacta TaxID=376703 RepID=A0AAD4QL46_9AGAM|nr:hypothetical protein B0F90DRAFT_361047 [Multifurca ochricompacta]
MNKLPTEVIVDILAILDIKELLACRSICRHLHGIISNSIVLQYHILLAASGMCDGPPSEVSTAERMAALQTYNTAWRELTWSSYDTIDIPEYNDPQFSNGVIVTISNYGKSLTVHRLPSKLRRVEACEWTLTFDFGIAEFIMDASQDLLALIPFDNVEADVFLILTLSNGQPHPLAMPRNSNKRRKQSSALAIELYDSDYKWSRIRFTHGQMNIHGDYIGTVVLEDLKIWNWKTGHQEWRLRLPAPNLSRQWFFLDNSHIVYDEDNREDPQSLCLRVCRFRCAFDTDPGTECVLEIRDLWRTPKLLYQSRVVSRATSPNGNDACGREALFYPSAEDSLLIIELCEDRRGSNPNISYLSNRGPRRPEELCRRLEGMGSYRHEDLRGKRPVLKKRALVWPA